MKQENEVEDNNIYLWLKMNNMVQLEDLIDSLMIDEDHSMSPQGEFDPMSDEEVHIDDIIQEALHTVDKLSITLNKNPELKRQYQPTIREVMSFIERTLSKHS